MENFLGIDAHSEDPIESKRLGIATDKIPSSTSSSTTRSQEDCRAWDVDSYYAGSDPTTQPSLGAPGDLGIDLALPKREVDGSESREVGTIGYHGIEYGTPFSYRGPQTTEGEMQDEWAQFLGELLHGERPSSAPAVQQRLKLNQAFRPTTQDDISDVDTRRHPAYFEYTQSEECPALENQSNMDRSLPISLTHQLRTLSLVPVNEDTCDIHRKTVSEHVSGQPDSETNALSNPLEPWTAFSPPGYPRAASSPNPAGFHSDMFARYHNYAQRGMSSHGSVSQGSHPSQHLGAFSNGYSSATQGTHVEGLAVQRPGNSSASMNSYPLEYFTTYGPGSVQVGYSGRQQPPLPPGAPPAPPPPAAPHDIPNTSQSSLDILYTMMQTCGIEPTRLEQSYYQKEGSLPQLLSSESTWSLRQFDRVPFPPTYIKGNALDFACDQVGSRYVQYLMCFASPNIRNMIWNELRQFAESLVLDRCGNYIVQRIFLEGFPQHKEELARLLMPQALRLSLHAFGCRVMQKALEGLPHAERVELILQLSGHVLECIFNEHGNHVIQRAISTVKGSDVQFIIDAVSEAADSVSLHMYGCRVIQRILEHCDAEQISQVLRKIMDQALHLAMDQFGNFVVQHILQYGTSEQRYMVVEPLIDHAVTLSRHRFASHVVEKALSVTNTEQRKRLIQSLMRPTADHENPVFELMNCKLGNFVLQKALSVSSQEEQTSLFDIIQHYADSASQSPYVKHVFSKMQQLQGSSRPSEESRDSKAHFQSALKEAEPRSQDKKERTSSRDEVSERNRGQGRRGRGRGRGGGGSRGRGRGRGTKRGGGKNHP